MKVITVGRDISNNYIVEDAQVSRNHLQIVVSDDKKMLVVDLGSANGTFVNGVRINGETQLRANDEVRAAGVKIPWQDLVGLKPVRKPVAPQQPQQPQKKSGGALLWIIICAVIVLASAALCWWIASSKNSEIEAAKTQVETLENELNKSKNEYNELKKEYDELNNKYDTFVIVANNKLGGNAEKINGLNEAAEKAKANQEAKQNELEQKIKELEDENNKLNATINSSKDEKTQIDKALIEKDTNIKQLKKDSTKLQEDLDAKKKNIKNLQDTLGHIRKIVKNKESDWKNNLRAYLGLKEDNDSSSIKDDEKTQQTQPAEQKVATAEQPQETAAKAEPVKETPAPQAEKATEVK